MGDRRQIHFTDMGIWFYTHHDGEIMPIKLQRVIKNAKPRWGDDPYCFRIILSQMIGKYWESEDGYGISNDYIDSEYNDFEVDIHAQTVNHPNWNKPKTFKEFTDMDIENEELI